MSSVGAAFLAGLGCGMWKMEQLQSLRKEVTVYKPSTDPTYLAKLETCFSEWKDAVLLADQRSETG